MTLLIITTSWFLIQVALVALSPAAFIVAVLWFQAIPIGWGVSDDAMLDTPIGQINVIAIQVLLLCLSAILAILRQSNRSVGYAAKFKWHLLFLFIGLISLSYAPSSAFGLRMVAKLSGPFLFMLAAMVSLDDHKQLRQAELAIVGSGAILVAMALLARALGVNSDPNAVLTGVSGLGPPGMGPPVFSAHMLPVASLLMARFLVSRRIGTLIALAVACASIVAALQRTSVGAMGLALAAIGLVSARGVSRAGIALLSVGAVPSIMLFDDVYRHRMFYENQNTQAIVNNIGGSVSLINGSGRFDMWHILLHRFFLSNPVLGAGAGATEQFFYGSSAGHGVAHSEYVRLLCEFGVVGLIAFLLLIGGYLLYLMRASRSSRGSQDATVYTAAAIGSVIAYACYMSTDNAFDYVNQFGIYVFGLVAMAVRANELAASTTVAEQAPQRLKPANLLE
jgi:hypothetical protein